MYLDIQSKIRQISHPHLFKIVLYKKGYIQHTYMYVLLQYINNLKSLQYPP